jgi:hypothetical protein
MYTTYICEKGGFGMYEGGYPTNEFLDPSHSGAAPAVIVVGTDEWLGGVSNKYTTQTDMDYIVLYA